MSTRSVLREFEKDLDDETEKLEGMRDDGLRDDGSRAKIWKNDILRYCQKRRIPSIGGAGMMSHFLKIGITPVSALVRLDSQLSRLATG